MKDINQGNIMTKIKTEEILKRKGFSLNTYAMDGALWEFEEKENEELKEKLCEIFNIDAELPETIILQCREDFTNCIFYYDCNVIDMDAMDFVECVKQMNDAKVINYWERE